MLGSLIFLKEISYISKEPGRWVESLGREVIPIHALPKPAQETLPLSSGYFMLTEDPWEIYLLPEFERGARAPLVLNPHINLGIATTHTDFDPEARAHTSTQTPLLSFPRCLFFLNPERIPTSLCVVQNLPLNDHEFSHIL